MRTPITVLLSVYNGARWLNDSIGSVLGQTHADFEFIIVNDGSNDDSLEIIEDFAAKDRRIRVINKPNTGLSDSLNLGLSLAAGDWIARIDADDVCEPNRLASQYAMAHSNNNFVLIGSGLFIIDEWGQRSKTFHYPKDHQKLVDRLINSKSFFPHSSAFIHSRTVRALGGYRNKFKRAEDFDLWLRLSEVGRIGCVHEPLVSIRKHADQISNYEGGRRQLVDARAALVSYLLRTKGYVDPCGEDSLSRDFAFFINFIEQGVKQDRLFEYRYFVEKLKASVDVKSFASCWLLAVSAAKSPRFVLRYLSSTVFGEKLAMRLTNEWVSRGLPCVE